MVDEKDRDHVIDLIDRKTSAVNDCHGALLLALQGMARNNSGSNPRNDVSHQISVDPFLSVDTPYNVVIAKGLDFTIAAH